MPLFLLPSSRLPRWLLLLTLLLLGVACAQSRQIATPAQISEVETAVPLLTPTQFTDNSFHIPLPNWPPVDSEDENTLIGVSQAGQVVAVARFANLPRTVGPFIADILPQHGAFQNIMRHVERPANLMIFCPNLSKY
ncbi:hypothetical protein MNBD_CHLOROFLEXI01-3988 [hydrothermal vent metagenome]|uniref:Uncharacterized protein n=1 Tax=hydrothermal vent metagenome TaxID=652676 RepID=A0A3B0UYA4_9ZZZZ